MLCQVRKGEPLRELEHVFTGQMNFQMPNQQCKRTERPEKTVC